MTITDFTPQTDMDLPAGHARSVVPLASVGSSHVLLVGGKGVNLGEMLAPGAQRKDNYS